MIHLKRYIKKYEDYNKYLKEKREYISIFKKLTIKLFKKDKVIRACPICNICDSTFIFKAPILEFVRCNNCGLVYAKEILSKKGYHKFYENSSVKLLKSKYLYATLSKKKVNRELSKPLFINKILRFSKGRDKCLDLGCSFGETLFHLKPYFKSVEGMELNKFASKVGEELFDIKIYNKDIMNLKLKGLSYDCIILNQVIEHLDNFDFFSEIHKLLKPGGIVYIGCPYMNSLSMTLFKERNTHVYNVSHINMFDFKSFKAFAKKYKFKIKSIQTDNSLNIQLNDLIRFIFKNKEFVHRHNDIPLTNFLNIGINLFSNWFYNKTNIISRCKLGSYLEVILEKE